MNPQISHSKRGTCVLLSVDSNPVAHKTNPYINHENCGVRIIGSRLRQSHVALFKKVFPNCLTAFKNHLTNFITQSPNFSVPFLNPISAHCSFAFSNGDLWTVMFGDTFWSYFNLSFSQIPFVILPSA